MRLQRRALLAFLLVAGGGLGAGAAPAAAAPCDQPIANEIACENTKPGNPASEWDVSGSGSASIQGYATSIGVDQGETVSFKVDTPSTDYRIDIYRMGYYGGSGARKITTIQPSASLPQNQPGCQTTTSTGLIDCGNWGVSASWAVPADAVSGIYLAKLVREDGTAGSSHMVFVVRDRISLRIIIATPIPAPILIRLQSMSAAMTPLASEEIKPACGAASGEVRFSAPGAPTNPYA